METQGVIEWNREKLERFEKTYEKAMEVNAEQFMFDGYEFYVGYAKYLIEYLESRLGPK